MWWVWTSSRWYGSGTSSAGMVAAAGMSGESGNGRYRWSTVGAVDSTKGPSAGKAAGWRGIPRRAGRLTEGNLTTESQRAQRQGKHREGKEHYFSLLGVSFLCVLCDSVVNLALTHLPNSTN